MHCSLPPLFTNGGRAMSAGPQSTSAGVRRLRNNGRLAARLGPGLGAASVTFAQFHEAPSTVGNPFSYEDLGGQAQLVSRIGVGANGVPIPVTFSYLASIGLLPADLSGNKTRC